MPEKSQAEMQIIKENHERKTSTLVELYKQITIFFIICGVSCYNFSNQGKITNRNFVSYTNCFCLSF